MPFPRTHKTPTRIQIERVRAREREGDVIIDKYEMRKAL
uniref:Uncharacterized protein n=1 Tax=Rhizophora mucronata TaxID=61149 RepID=A0A2P2L5V1_RHIMU